MEGRSVLFSFKKEKSTKKENMTKWFALSTDTVDYFLQRFLLVPFLFQKKRYNTHKIHTVITIQEKFSQNFPQNATVC